MTQKCKLQTIAIIFVLLSPLISLPGIGSGLQANPRTGEELHTLEYWRAYVIENAKLEEPFDEQTERIIDTQAETLYLRERGAYTDTSVYDIQYWDRWYKENVIPLHCPEGTDPAEGDTIYGAVEILMRTMSLELTIEESKVEAQKFANTVYVSSYAVNQYDDKERDITICTKTNNPTPWHDAVQGIGVYTYIRVFIGWWANVHEYYPYQLHWRSAAYVFTSASDTYCANFVSTDFKPRLNDEEALGYDLGWLDSDEQAVLDVWTHWLYYWWIFWIGGPPWNGVYQQNIQGYETEPTHRLFLIHGVGDSVFFGNNIYNNYVTGGWWDKYGQPLATGWSITGYYNGMDDTNIDLIGREFRDFVNSRTSWYNIEKMDIIAHSLGGGVLGSWLTHSWTNTPELDQVVLYQSPGSSIWGYHPEWWNEIFAPLFHAQDYLRWGTGKTSGYEIENWYSYYFADSVYPQNAPFKLHTIQGQASSIIGYFIGGTMQTVVGGLRENPMNGADAGDGVLPVASVYTPDVPAGAGHFGRVPLAHGSVNLHEGTIRYVLGFAPSSAAHPAYLATPVPTVTASASATTVLAGQPIYFTASTTGGGGPISGRQSWYDTDGYGYMWSVMDKYAGSSTPGVRQTVTYLPRSETRHYCGYYSIGKTLTYTFNTPGLYTVRVRSMDNNLMGDWDRLIINVTSPEPIAVINGPSTLLQGQTANFDAHESSWRGTPTFYWDFGDDTPVQETSTWDAPPHEYYIPTGTTEQPDPYTVTVTITDEYGSDSISMDTTVINANPTIEPINDIDINDAETISITPTITDPGLEYDPITSYDWEINGQHYYTETIDNLDLDEIGEWECSLTVEDSFGGSDTEPFSITIVDDDTTKPEIDTQIDAYILNPEGGVNVQFTTTATDESGIDEYSIEIIVNGEVFTTLGTHTATVHSIQETIEATVSDADNDRPNDQETEIDITEIDLTNILKPLIIGAITSILEEVEASDNDCWHKKPKNRKNAMENKLNEVLEIVYADNYEEAYDKLLHDIKPKLSAKKTNENEIPWDNRGVFYSPWVLCEYLQERFRVLLNTVLHALQMLLL